MSEQASDAPKARRIKIVGSGDGPVHNWSITDAESGEPIRWVRRIELVADARGSAEVVLYIDRRGVDIEIDAALIEERAEELTAAERVAGEVEQRIKALIADLRIAGMRQ